MYYLSDLSKRLLKVACLNTLNFGIIFWYNFTKLLSFFSKKSSFGKGVFLRGHNLISFSQVSSMAALLIRYAHKQSAKYSSMYFNFVICSIIFFQGRVAVIIFQKYKTLSTWNNYFIVENPSRVHTNIFQISGFFLFFQ